MKWVLALLPAVVACTTVAGPGDAAEHGSLIAQLRVTSIDAGYLAARRALHRMPSVTASDLLVAGDDAARANDVALAATMYRLALDVDPSLAAAAARLDALATE